jgi:hypothetical protein
MVISMFLSSECGELEGIYRGYCDRQEKKSHVDVKFAQILLADLDMVVVLYFEAILF